PLQRLVREPLQQRPDLLRRQPEGRRQRLRNREDQIRAGPVGAVLPHLPQRLVDHLLLGPRLGRAPLRALEHVPRHPRQSHLQLRRGLTLPPVELLLPRLAVVRLRPPRLERGLLVDVLALQHRRLAADPLLELADHFLAALRHLLAARREHLHDLDRHTNQLALAVAVPPCPTEDLDETGLGDPLTDRGRRRPVQL